MNIEARNQRIEDAPHGPATFVCELWAVRGDGTEVGPKRVRYRLTEKAAEQSDVQAAVNRVRERWRTELENRQRLDPEAVT